MSTQPESRTPKPKRRRMGCSLLCIVRTLRLWFDYFVDFVLSLYYKGSSKIVPGVQEKQVTMSATQIARKIRDGEVKCEDIVRYHISRIKEVNGLINAVVDDRFEDALVEARKVDEDIASGVITAETFKEKPFLGVPFTSKESTICEGMSTSFGLLARKGMKGEEDADIIKNMKNAGAILIGVTNVPQVNLWFETHNPVYGYTNNPYDTTRNVGGSSGGEGSIIAACGSPIGVGTDIGGSIRIPSNMCGIFGHKLSNELTPTKGLTYRNGSEAPTTMVVCGPMTRYAEDLIPGIKAMIGPAHKRLKLDAEVDVKKLKYYYVLDGGDILMSTPRPDVIESMKKVIRHFEETAQTEELHIPETKYSTKLYKYWLSLECKNFKRDLTGRKSEVSMFSEFFKYLTGRSEFQFPAMLALINFFILPIAKAPWAEKVTKQLKSDLIDKLGDDGVLLYMSMPMVAQRHHNNYLRPFNLTNFGFFNFLKFPVTQVPLGLNAEGVPLGIQVAAAPYNDHLTIAVAKELERVFGGYVPPFSSV